MQYVRLGEVIHSAKSARCGDDDYPVLSITKSEGIILQSDKFKKRIASQDTSLYKIVCRGQLVQGIHIDEANFGIQDIVDAGIVSPAYKIWDVNSDRIIPKYLEEVLRSPRSIQYYASNFNGSIKRRERLTDKDFLAMEIPCPSLEEQDYTLSVIRKMRHILFYRRKEISAMDDLIKARFVEMFGDPMINNKGYELRRYGDLFELNAGGTPSKMHSEYWDGGTIPWIGSNMCQNTYIYGNDGYYITEEGFNHSSAKMFPVDTVLVALVGATIGKTALLKFETTTNQNVLGIRGIRESGYTPEFVYYYTQGLNKKFLELADGGFAMASKGFISDLLIPLVDLESQEAFTLFANKVDKSKLKIQAAIDVAQSLFNSLMQQYFG